MRTVRLLVFRSFVAGLMVAMTGSMVGLSAQAKKKHDTPAKSSTSSKDSASTSKTTNTKTDSKTPASTETKPTATKVPSKADSKSAK